MTSRLPGTHQASSPARRFPSSPGTWPFRVTTPSSTATSIQPLVSIGVSRMIFSAPESSSRSASSAKAGSCNSASRTATRISLSPMRSAGATCSRSTMPVTAGSAAACSSASFFAATSATSPSMVSVPSAKSRAIGWACRSMRGSLRSACLT